VARFPSPVTGSGVRGLPAALGLVMLLALWTPGIVLAGGESPSGGPGLVSAAAAACPSADPTPTPDPSASPVAGPVSPECVVVASFSGDALDSLNSLYIAALALGVVVSFSLGALVVGLIWRR